MKITDIRVRAVRSPVYKRFTNSMGKALSRPDGWTITIVEVFTDEGVTGVLTSIFGQGLTSDIIQKYLKPLIVGHDPLNYERIWGLMFGDHNVGQHWRYPYAKGEVVRAMSMVDTAIWDIIGKSAGLPVYKLLGGYRDDVPCYASGGHYISTGDHRAEMDFIGPEMQRYMDMGFKAVKMRCGRDLIQDLERAKLVREIIGPTTKLMVDFNMSGSYRGGVPHMIKYMRALEVLDPFWFEDPLAMDDVSGMKMIADAIDTNIATGETEQTIWGFRDLIVNRAVDIILPDAAQMCGGISQWRKIAALAEAYRIPVAAHIGDISHVHCVAAVPNGLIVEVFLPHDEGYAAHELAPVRRPDKSGNLTVPKGPGLGIALNEDYIQKHLIE